MGNIFHNNLYGGILMRWLGRRQSSNVDDRRSSGGGKGPAIGGGGLILVLILSLIFGGPEAVLQNLGVLNQGSQTEYVETEEDRELAAFVKVVLADTEDVWHEVFKEYGNDYKEPTLVIYSGYVQSACGSTSSAVGPFYCPGDESLYIDLSFYEDLKTRFKAPGDFAMAYVIAHEVGHHIQNLYGTLDQMQTIRQKVSDTEYNRYSVRLELQADYLAGVWASRVEDKGYIEVGDIDEAIRAAEAVGDDNIQKQSQGYVVPDSFTHGTSEQRAHWFLKGYETGDLSNWDTFSSSDGF